MSSLSENKNEPMNKGKPFNRKLLKALVISGVVTIAAVNPFFGVLAAHVAREEFRKRKWKQFQGDLYYLQKKGFIKTKRRPDGSYVVKVTHAGRAQSKKYEIDDIYIKIPKKWDKQWRFVIFDIPAAKQRERKIFLAKLKKLGFVMLQKSIWAYPFECHNEINKLAKMIEIDSHVYQLVCNHVSAMHLREEFENYNNLKLG